MKKTIAGYIATVVAVNLAFSVAPHLNWLWSIAVGGIFVMRDLVQRQIGHWVLLPMLVALALSYLLADPFVALASALAFACSEAADWLVFTVTRRPLRDRVLWSCAASAPVDSAVFLLVAGFFGWQTFALQVVSKLAAAVLVWLWARSTYRMAAA